MVVLSVAFEAGQGNRFPEMGISYFGKMIAIGIRSRNEFCGEPMQKSSHDKKYARILVALKKARLAAGLTQTDVAKRFGAHASFVSKCESGERRIDVLELSQFCRLYGVKVAKFLESVGID